MKTLGQWNAEARATLSEGAQVVYFEGLEAARIRYRERIAAAIEGYHTNIGSLWRIYGKPATSLECARALQIEWKRLEAALVEHSRVFRDAPELNYLYAALAECAA